MKLLLWLIFLPLAADRLAASPAQVHVPVGFASWSLAYVRDGNIWIANADGTGQRQLTHKRRRDLSILVAG